MNLHERSMASTFACAENWKILDAPARRALINAIIDRDENFSILINLVDVKDDGQVILSLKEALGPDRRGTLLLDFEDALKRQVDIGLNVWLEPLGDRSSLRKLRGIEVKKA